MNIQVRSGDHVYEVEVGDVHARPIIATIAGERYEVWPEATPAGAGTLPPEHTQAAKVVPFSRATESSVDRTLSASASTPAAPPAGGRHNPRYLRAPLPGVIIAVMAEPGQQIIAGQELCVLEAMKMQNTIRATRSGQIARVHVAVDQQVQHNDVLIEYVD
jgi:biotin carboxyl carrier protein